MPDHFDPITVALDSNVLFSASRDPQSRFHEFWKMVGVAPLTSFYSIEEVRRHVKKREHDLRLQSLLQRTKIVGDGALQLLPAKVHLVPKDRPILATAISAQADYLVTGDANHFGHLYETTVVGVRVLTPRSFLDLYAYRLIK